MSRITEKVVITGQRYDDLVQAEQSRLASRERVEELEEFVKEISHGTYDADLKGQMVARELLEGKALTPTNQQEKDAVH